MQLKNTVRKQLEAIKRFTFVPRKKKTNDKNQPYCFSSDTKKFFA